MKNLISWCECSFLDVDIITYGKILQRKKEIVLKSPMTSPALIKCIKDGGLHHTFMEKVVDIEFNRQYELVNKTKQFNYNDYIIFDRLIHDMTFLTK